MTDTANCLVSDVKEMNNRIREMYPNLFPKLRVEEADQGTDDEDDDYDQVGVDKAGIHLTQNMKKHGIHMLSEEFENTMISENVNGALFRECHYFSDPCDLSNDPTVFCVVGNSNKDEMMKRRYISVTVHHINEAGQLPPSLESSIPAGGSSSNNDVTGSPHTETANASAPASNSHANTPTGQPSPTGQHSPTEQSSQSNSFPSEPSPTPSSMGPLPQEPQAPPPDIPASQEPQSLNVATPRTVPHIKDLLPNEDPCDMLIRWFQNQVSEELPAYRTWTDGQHGIELRAFKNRIMGYAQSYIYIMCHEDVDHSLVKRYTALLNKAKQWLTSLKANGGGGFTVRQYDPTLPQFTGSYFKQAQMIANHAVGSTRDSQE